MKDKTIMPRLVDVDYDPLWYQAELARYIYIRECIVRERNIEQPWARLCSHAAPDARDIARADDEARAQP